MVGKFGIEWVSHYEEGKYDVAILHLDQQCLEDSLWDKGKGSVYRELNEVINDIPKIVIMHGTPYYPETFLSDITEDNYEEKGYTKDQIGMSSELIERTKKAVGDNIMICNSHTAQKQWGFGQTIIHGMDEEEWFDLPKEPRVVTMISPGGLDRYYDRSFLSAIKDGLEEKGIHHCHITVDAQFKNWTEYRNFLGRSLVYLNPTKESPMPRARTEAMLCLKPESKVIMADNLSVKKISDIEIGDKIINKEGSSNYITNIHKKNTNENFYNIKILGYESIDCSAEHKFLCLKTSKFERKSKSGSGDCYIIPKPYAKESKYRKQFLSLTPEWIKAKNLKTNDLILSPRFIQNDKSADFIEINIKGEKVEERDDFIRWKSSKNNLEKVCKDYGISFNYVKEKLRTKKFNGIKINNFIKWLKIGNYTKIGYLPKKIKITSNLSRFIGYYLAEGYISGGSTINFCFHKKENKYHQDVVFLGKLLFNLDFKVKIKDNKAIISANHKLLSEWLKIICGKSAKEKIIPKEFIVSENKEIIGNLLAGLYRGDGYIGKEIVYTTISENLAYQTHFLLRKLGLIGHISKCEVKERMRYERYDIRTTGNNADTLKKIINDLCKNHKEICIKEEIEKCCNYLVMTIKSNLIHLGVMDK